MDIMKLIIQTTCVADSVALFISSPERRCCCSAVCTNERLAIYLMLIKSGTPSARSGATSAITLTTTGTSASTTITLLFCWIHSLLMDRSLQCRRSQSISRLEIETTSITYSLAVGTSSPQRRSSSTAICTLCSRHRVHFLCQGGRRRRRSSVS